MSGDDGTTAVTDITPISRESDAEPLAHEAYHRLLDLLERLDHADWGAPTSCPGWTVADMVGHMIGAARSHASIPEFLRQQAWGQRHRREYDGNSLDATNDLQVRDHRHLTPTERIAALRELAPKAVHGRMRMPGLLRRAPLPIPQSGSTVGMPAKLGLGHLMDAVLTRDVWLHRIDIADASGQALQFDAAFDGRLVEDVVAEWAGEHDQPFSLHLTGPAGGRFRQGTGGETIELDAIDFCRVLSGREDGGGLLRTHVLF